MGSTASSVYSWAKRLIHFSGVLISKALTNFQKASEKLREHFIGVGGSSARKYHLIAMEKAEHFRDVLDKKQVPIDEQLSSLKAKRVAQNRAMLQSIVETIFCGRQGIALRGHRDDQKHMEQQRSGNHGNFWALLQFRVSSGDSVLSEHLSSPRHRNARYVSKTVQNELINICGDMIRQAIVAEIQSAGIYSIMADEATDSSNKEQLYMTIRYVNDKTRLIEERFVGFTECGTGVTGEALSDHIIL